MEASQATTLYEFKGSDPSTIDASAYLFANLRVPGDNIPLYSFPEDTAPGDQKGVSEDWAVYTGPTEVFPAPAAEGDQAAADAPAPDAPADPPVPPAPPAPAAPGAESAPDTPPADGAGDPAGGDPPSGDAPAPDADPAPAAEGEPVEDFAEIGDPIVGDSGLQPLASLDQVDVNRPVATSPPPPQAQSGVPLAEDRAAGVKADPAMAGNVAPSQPEVAGS